MVNYCVTAWRAFSARQRNGTLQLAASVCKAFSEQTQQYDQWDNHHFQKNMACFSLFTTKLLCHSQQCFKFYKATSSVEKVVKVY